MFKRIKLLPSHHSKKKLGRKIKLHDKRGVAKIGDLSVDKVRKRAVSIKLHSTTK
jgi:hypothetical protein